MYNKMQRDCDMPQIQTRRHSESAYIRQVNFVQNSGP